MTVRTRANTSFSSGNTLAARAALVLAGLFGLACIGACGDEGAAGTDTRGDTADTTPGDTDPDGADLPDGTDDVDAGDTSDAVDAADSAADTADTSRDTDPGDTADTADGELGPELTVDRYGARVWGPIIQMSRVGRGLWLGTRGVPEPLSGVIRGGLYRLDLDTGAVRHYEEELPREDYSTFDLYEPGTFGPTPTAGVQGDLVGIVAVTHAGLVAIDEGAGGVVTPFTVTLEGAPVIPIQLAIARDGLRPVAWLTSDKGLLRLDEDTFTVESVTDGTDLALDGDTGGDFGKLAVDPATGAVYAAYFPTNGASRVVRVGVDGKVKVLTPGEGGLPTGRVGDIVWNPTRGEAYIALGAWNSGQGGVIVWNGETAQTLLKEGALATAHSGSAGPFGAQILALDDEHQRLAVGGQLRSELSGLKGGGVVALDLSTLPPRALGFAQRNSPLVHWHANHLAWDASDGRLYAAMSDACSETRLRNRGLFALRFTATGEVRYERPILSGVRAVGLRGADGQSPWVGLRDDNGGLACEGYVMQSGFGPVLAEGGLDLNPVIVTQSDGMGGIVVDPGVTAVDLGVGMALGTYRDGFFFGTPRDGRVEGYAGNQALIGPSLFTEAVLHTVGDVVEELWIAGRTSHQQGDSAQLADRGPRGAARLVFADGVLQSAQRYVRTSEDKEDITGLPSSDIRDLVRDADGSVIAACATERVDLAYDRMEPAVFTVDGVARKGGVVRLGGGAEAVEILANAEVAPDARALARDPSGRLLVADAERGILRREGDAWVPVSTPGLEADAIPTALWAGAGDDLAVATSRGLWARLGGRVVIADDVGFAWALAYRGGRLWVGTDEGLLFVRPVTMSANPLPGRATPAPLPFE
ncbi:MAG: hypothetical protein JNJ59_09465 [Deltaproteobacteria bacterium]|nr:hypothetical protein [Deltaproteobacteria bacterium]